MDISPVANFSLISARSRRASIAFAPAAARSAEVNVGGGFNYL